MITRLSRGLSVVLVAAMLVSMIVPAYASDNSKLEAATISSFTDVIGSTYINAGKGEGVNVGATGSVLRDGKEIAKYKVIQVNWGISRIDLYDVQDGYTARPGDRAPVLTNPSSGNSKSTVLKALGIVAAVALIAVLVKGHSGGGGGGTTASAITLTTSKTSSVNGDGDVTCTVTITAKINLASGDAVPDGTPVVFSTTAGTLNHTQTYAVAGTSSAVLTYNSATDPDTATITVKCAGQTAKTTVSFTSSIDLVANPTTIQIVGSGGAVTQSAITAICTDVTGTPVTSGTVHFSASFGTINPTSAPIDGSGVATATFTSTQAGKANIMATWSNSQALALLTVTAGPPFLLTIASSPSSVPCDGNSSSRITATVRDSGGNLATDGTVVNFSVTPDGGGGGNGAIAAQAVTSNGVATAYLLTRDAGGTKSLPGTATVKAQVLVAGQPATVPAPATDLEATTPVQFTPSDVGTVSLGATKTNIRGLDIVGNTTTITALVSATGGSAVPDGTDVAFTTTAGQLSSSHVATSNGRATVTLTSDASGGNGNVTVTATAGTVTSAPLAIVFSGGPFAANCSYVTDPNPAVLAKSGGQATITITAHDVNDHALVDGTTVTAVTSKGTLLTSSAQTSDGTATFTLLTSTDALNPTDPGAGTVTVTIPAGGAGSNVTLQVPFTVSP